MVTSRGRASVADDERRGTGQQTKRPSGPIPGISTVCGLSDTGCRRARLTPAVIRLIHGRARSNTMRAHAHDLKTCFAVVGKDHLEVRAKDVFGFTSAQQRARPGAENVARITDGGSGLSGADGPTAAGCGLGELWLSDRPRRRSDRPAFLGQAAARRACGFRRRFTVAGRTAARRRPAPHFVPRLGCIVSS